MIPGTILPWRRLSLRLLFAGLSVGLISMASATAPALHPPRPTYDAPDWLVKASTDPETSETALVSLTTKAYGSQSSDWLARLGNRTIGLQPQGALSGKVVFAMAGHGWTYERDTMHYYTQRGLHNDMIEDLGNADQMHVFAHLLFNSGATVVPLRPVDHQVNERVIDNSMDQVQFFGTWYQGTGPDYFGPTVNNPVHYAFARASMTESAIARYRPWIPEAGFYPVYAWASSGADRSDQLFRIVHSGGVDETRVNFRRVGRAWVWLGTYYFDKGDQGFVDISNEAIDPYDATNGRVVVADAIRFGNGMGDVPRPGGISGFPREDEGDCYWIERSLGPNAERRLFSALDDGVATVGSPPRTAAYLNRETEGSFFDRLLISFHSNSGTGKSRGAVGLFNRSENQRPDYQQLLAEILGNEVNDRMRADSPIHDLPWTDQHRVTYNGITFGELRRDYLQDEMCATIVEVAFHDNAEDSRLLLNPLARLDLARATLRGVFKWYREIRNTQSALPMLPAAPRAISCNLSDSGKIHVKWTSGRHGRYFGDPATSFLVQRSADGFGFDGGTMVHNIKEADIDPITTSGVTFVRVLAANASGVSLQSPMAAVSNRINPARKGSQPRILIVQAPITLDGSLDPQQPVGINPNSPYQEEERAGRARPIEALAEPLGREIALAASDAGMEFNGASASALDAEMVLPGDYDIILVAAGVHNPETPLFSRKTLRILTGFVDRGGNLFMNAGRLASNADRLKGDNGKAIRDFLRTILCTRYQSSLEEFTAASSTSNRFFPTAEPVQLVHGMELPGWPVKKSPVDVLGTIKNRSIPILKYANGGGVAAVLSQPATSQGKVIYMAVPFRNIESESLRARIMTAVLKQL